jgi:predicted outer membrane repeat protein
VNNIATDWDGGGIFLGASTAHLESCAFSGNTADYGGGVACVNSPTDFENCSFSGNSATHGGGLVSAFAASTSDVVNSVFRDNTPDQIYDMENAVTTVSYSNVQGGYSGDGNIDADPLFVDAGAGDLSLSAGSPCIDAADGDVAPELDIDGNARVDDPDTPNTGVGAPDYTDMGAYEYQP